MGKKFMGMGKNIGPPQLPPKGGSYREGGEAGRGGAAPLHVSGVAGRGGAAPLLYLRAAERKERKAGMSSL